MTEASVNSPGIGPATGHPRLISSQFSHDPSTMQAQTIARRSILFPLQAALTQYANPSVLKTVPKPSPAANEVLIKVETFAAVSEDASTLTTEPYGRSPPRLPRAGWIHHRLRLCRHCRPSGNPRQTIRRRRPTRGSRPRRQVPRPGQRGRVLGCARGSHMEGAERDEQPRGGDVWRRLLDGCNGESVPTGLMTGPPRPTQGAVPPRTSRRQAMGELSTFSLTSVPRLWRRYLGRHVHDPARSRLWLPRHCNRLA